MAEGTRTVRGEYRLSFTKTVEAPSSYVYAWCTDFRPSDGRVSSSRPKYRIQRLAPGRIARLRTVRPAKGRPRFSLEMIRLHPPNAWHVDQIDEDDLATVDYRVTRLGPRRSKVTLRIAERWMVRPFPSREEYRRSSSRYWDRLVRWLEDDYRRGRPAVG